MTCQLAENHVVFLVTLLILDAQSVTRCFLAELVVRTIRGLTETVGSLEQILTTDHMFVKLGMQLH